jgi:hypothetical protein
MGQGGRKQKRGRECMLGHVCFLLLNSLHASANAFKYVMVQKGRLPNANTFGIPRSSGNV